MRKTICILSVMGLLLCLCASAQADTNLLWDIPAQLDEAEYVQAVESAAGIELSLSQSYGTANTYSSSAGSDMELYDMPVRLSVSFNAGKLTNASMWIDTDAFLSASSWEEAVNALFDYQQVLVAAMTQRFGAPTSGMMITGAGGGVEWNYPGGESGRLNRAQLDAVIASEDMGNLLVTWDNVSLWVDWENWEGEMSLNAYVFYTFDEQYMPSDADGFSNGFRYAGGEGWVDTPMGAVEETTGNQTEDEGDTAAETPTGDSHYLLWDIPVDLNEDEYLHVLRTQKDIEMEMRWEYERSCRYESTNDGLLLYDAPASLGVVFSPRENLAWAELTIGADYFLREADATQSDAIELMLDYQQTLVTALTEKYGAPTGGILITNIREDVDGDNWDYPGSPDGQLNRDAAHAAILESRRNICIAVFWKNVRLNIYGRIADGVPDLEVSVCYSFEDDYWSITGLDHESPYLMETKAEGATAVKTTSPQTPTTISLWNDLEKWNVRFEKSGYDVDVSVPQITGLEDKSIEDDVNGLLRDAVYEEAGTYEERQGITRDAESILFSYEYVSAWLEDAWVSGNVLAVYCGESHGGSGDSTAIILYIDLLTGKELSSEPLFKNEKTVEMAIKSHTWERVGGADNTTWNISYQDVMDTDPSWYWVGVDGLAVIYDDETLDRRQVDVLIPWADIAPYMNLSNDVYAAVMGEVQKLQFDAVP